MSIIPEKRLREALDLPDWRFVNHQLRKAAILREADRFPRTLKVLDVGCAAGDVTIELAGMGFEARGIELEDWRLQVATDLGRDVGSPAVFEKSDAARLRDTGERFGLIIMGEILEHFYEPWEILDEIAQVCEPRAHIIATTPNMASLRARLKLSLLGMFPDHNPEHRYFYTCRRFREMVARTRFEVLACRTIVPTLFYNLGPLTRLERGFWSGVNGVLGGLGENLLALCRLKE